MKNESYRSPAMDIIRCFAFFFVASVHFFLNSGFYGVKVEGFVMYIMTLMRSFFMICVPLFLLLSGYLMCNKKVSKSYYKKLIYTLTIYFIASVFCVIHRIFFTSEPSGIKDIIKSFLDFTAAPYAWYVEMYIGLFLLCPFLNLIYNGLDNKKHKQILVATLIFLTALPGIVNIYKGDLSWFLNPASSNKYVKLMPSFWAAIYPITYYFIGCYLREFKLKMSCKKIALLSALVFIINGSFNFYRSFGKTFIWGAWQNYGVLPILVQAVLFFAFFDNMNFEKFPVRLSKLFAKLSSLCFGAYLVSWIFDETFYPILLKMIPQMRARLPFYILIVPAVFVCSLLLSFVVNKIYNLGAKILQKGK